MCSMRKNNSMRKKVRRENDSVCRGGDAVSRREDSDQVPLEQGLSARLSHALGEEEPSGRYC